MFEIYNKILDVSLKEMRLLKLNIEILKNRVKKLQSLLNNNDNSKKRYSI